MDINLFEDFNSKKVGRVSLVLIILFSVLIISLISIMIFNQYKIMHLNSELNKRIEIVENPKSLEKIKEAKELNSELDKTKKELEKLDSLDKNLSNFDSLTYEVLDIIESKTQKGIVLSSINYENNIMELNGVSISPNRIAEYSQSISEIQNVANIHISNISLNERYYNFLISLTLKGDSIESYN